MLKITTKTEPTKATFELEGTLAGAWVDELEQCWREIPPGYAVKLSLEAVTFIDSNGKRLLARLHKSGAELKASGCMTRCIVQEIISENQRK
ncbi:MAG: hypothetical protein ACREQV_18165 [Candidatus Binatia bacterium]